MPRQPLSSQVRSTFPFRRAAQPPNPREKPGLKVAAESAAPGSSAVGWDCDPNIQAEQFQFWSNGEVVSDYGLCLSEPGPTSAR